MLLGFSLMKYLFGNSRWYANAVKTMQKGQSGIGGFPMGAGRAGHIWSSGISSGFGFSGGGGSSGGGGASGSW